MALQYFPTGNEATQLYKSHHFLISKLNVEEERWVLSPRPCKYIVLSIFSTVLFLTVFLVLVNSHLPLLIIMPLSPMAFGNQVK